MATWHVPYPTSRPAVPRHVPPINSYLLLTLTFPSIPDPKPTQHNTHRPTLPGSTNNRNWVRQSRPEQNRGKTEPRMGDSATASNLQAYHAELVAYHSSPASDIESYSQGQKSDSESTPTASPGEDGSISPGYIILLPHERETLLFSSVYLPHPHPRPSLHPSHTRLYHNQRDSVEVDSYFPPGAGYQPPTSPVSAYSKTTTRGDMWEGADDVLPPLPPRPRSSIGKGACEVPQRHRLLALFARICSRVGREVTG